MSYERGYINSVSQVASAGAPKALASLTDATISSPLAGNMLFYRSDSKWHNEVPPDWITSTNASAMVVSQLSPYLTSNSASTGYASIGHNHTLTSLTNVTISAATEGQFIVFNSATGEWYNTYTFTSAVVANQGINLPDTTAASVSSGIKIFSFNQQGFSIFHFTDSTGAQIELARDNFVVVKNTDVSAITKGQAVYITGGTGTIPTVARAKANSLNTLPAIGLMFEDTAVNAHGRCMIIGNIEHLDTSGFTAGNILYVSPTTAGDLTNTKPVAPNFAQNLGTVLFSGVGNGVIMTYARGIQGITAISAASDVTISSPTDNQYLTFVSADGKWHNTTIPDWITSAAASVLVSALTVNYITSASASTLASVVAQAQTIQSHTGVSISSLGDGQVLVYRTADSKWHNEAQSGGTGITKLVSAADVTISSPTDNQYLTFVSADGKWHNTTIPDWITSTNASAISSAIASAVFVTNIGPYLTSSSLNTLNLGYKLISIVTVGNVTAFSITLPAGGYSAIRFFCPSFKVSATTTPTLQMQIANTAGTNYTQDGYGYGIGTGVSPSYSLQINGTMANLLVSGQVSVGTYHIMLDMTIFYPYEEIGGTNLKKVMGRMISSPSSASVTFTDYTIHMTSVGQIGTVTFQTSTGFVGASCGYVYVYGDKDA